MRVTLSMILDYMEKEDIITLRYIQGNPGFVDLRLYYDGAPAQPEYLYFHPNPNFSPPEEFAACYFVHPMSSESTTAHKTHPRFLCLCEPNKLFPLLQDCFYMYKHWYLQMNEMILNGAGIQELVDLSQKIIPNPIVVDDPSFRLLAFNKKKMSELTDTESVFLVKNHFRSPKYVDTISSNPVFLKNLENRHGPFVHHYDFLPHPSIYSPIFYQERLVGFLNIIGHYVDLTEGALDTARIFVSVVSKVLGMSGLASYHSHPEENIILSLLRGKPVDENTAKLCLERMGMVPTGEYYIAKIRFVPKAEVLLSMQQQLVRLLKELLPQSRLLIDGYAVVAIVDKKKIPFAAFVEALDELSYSHKFIVGFSLPFFGNAPLNEYYRQAQQSLVWNDYTQNPAERFFYYQDILTYDLISHMGDSQGQNALKHQALQQLEQYDKNKNADLKESLYVFLQEGRDANAAARRLHIHKNSLYYRLGKISELTGINLEDNVTCEHLQISFSVEKMQARMKSGVETTV